MSFKPQPGAVRVPMGGRGVINATPKYPIYYVTGVFGSFTAATQAERLAFEKSQQERNTIISVEVVNGPGQAAKPYARYCNGNPMVIGYPNE